MSKNLTHEQKTISSFIAAGVMPCETFAPHCQTHFLDKRGSLNEHRPDYIYRYADGRVLYIESKQGGAKALNSKQSKEASHNKLRCQYEHRFKCKAGNMSHSALSTALWKAGYHNDCLDHAWNHSLTKVLLTQKSLGPEQFLVVFTDEPNENHKKLYDKKGLHYITLDNLRNFLS